MSKIEVQELELKESMKSSGSTKNNAKVSAVAIEKQKTYLKRCNFEDCS